MIDIHSHLLFGLDDGSKNLEESIKMIEQYIKNGFKGVIMTTHFYPGKYDFDLNIYNKNCTILDNYIKNNNLDFTLYKGNEIFLTENINNDLEKNKALVLNNSRYILIELPFLGTPNYAKHFLYETMLNGYVPIIAHAERYKFVQNEDPLFKELLDIGCLVQINISSIKNKESNEYKCLMKLLENKIVSFVATDSHSSTWRSPEVSDYYSILQNLIDDEYYKEICYENIFKLLNNKNIKTRNYENKVIKKKSNFLTKLLNKFN